MPWAKKKFVLLYSQDWENAPTFFNFSNKNLMHVIIENVQFFDANLGSFQRTPSKQRLPQRMDSDASRY